MSKHKPYTFKLLDLMKNEYKLTNNKIFMHSFSNACGFILYQHLLNVRNGIYNGKDFNNEDYEFMTKNLCGFIGDSNFGFPHNPIDLFFGTVNLLESQIKSKLARILVSSTVVTTYQLYRLVKLGNDYFSNGFKIMLGDNLEIPFLFMYSKKDKLISPVEIKKFIDEKMKLHPNQYIKSIVYDDGEHVLLYLKHPEDYVRNINEHLGLCKIEMGTILNSLNIDKLNGQFSESRAKLISKL
jgi:hypothetical protein